MIGFGQGWEVILGINGDSNGKSVQQTTDGGYIICGYLNTFSGNSSDIYLIKTDENGVEEWSHTYGGTDSERGYSVQQTTDGGYIVCGGTIDIYLIKTDANGIEQWSQTFGGSGNDQGYSVQQTTDGGYIVCGTTNSFTNGSNNIYLIKTDENGVEQWSEIFGGMSNDFGRSVKQTNDGGFIIIGVTESFSNLLYNAYLIKTDSYGVEQWSKIYGDTATNGFSVQQTSDGGFIITGDYYDFDNSQADLYLIKTDVDGQEQWSQTIGGVSTDEDGNSVQQTTDGGYIITGSKVNDYYVSTTRYLYLVKTNDNGLEQWSQTFGTGSERGFSVQQTSDGGFIIAGESLSNLYLVKTDGNGNTTSTFNIPINPNRKLQNTIDIFGKETKTQTNTPLIDIYDDGTVEKRITIE